jgi:hypothetical protein
VVDKLVEATFQSGLSICPRAVLTGRTDSDGRVTLVFAGGGCVNNITGACVLRVEGLIFRSFDTVRSPDWGGAGGGDGQVNVIDLVSFAVGYRQQQPGCTDYNGVNDTDLGDFVVFASAYAPPHSCQ